MSLLVRLASDSFFSSKKILVLDSDDKTVNDRTWCFWEKDTDIFEPIVHHVWEELDFFSNHFSTLLDIAPYKYKMIRGIDFYAYVKNAIAAAPNIEWRKASIKKLLKHTTQNLAGVELTDGSHIYASFVFSSILFESIPTGYLQSVGRLLRAYPGMEMVILQDHGGNWHRHGSPNADRSWVLGWNDNRYAQERKDAFRERKEKEPIVCPYCGAVREFGNICATCKKEIPRRGRLVIQQDGALKYIDGRIYKRRKVSQQSDTEQKWKACYYRCKHRRKTFRQAYTLFRRENGYYPPTDLPLMPKEKNDWYARVPDVPYSDLHSSTPKNREESSRLF